MKVLCFTFRGEQYRVNLHGDIKVRGIEDYSPTWRFLGGSRHHWRTGLDVTLVQAFENPELLNGCLGWDVDHGTIRTWGGSYNGKLPRISLAYMANQD